MRRLSGRLYDGDGIWHIVLGWKANGQFDIAIAIAGGFASRLGRLNTSVHPVVAVAVVCALPSAIGVARSLRRQLP